MVPRSKLREIIGLNEYLVNIMDSLRMIPAVQRSETLDLFSVGALAQT